MKVVIILAVVALALLATAKPTPDVGGGGTTLEVCETLVERITGPALAKITEVCISGTVQSWMCTCLFGPINPPQ